MGRKALDARRQSYQHVNLLWSNTPKDVSRRTLDVANCRKSVIKSSREHGRETSQLKTLATHVFLGTNCVSENVLVSRRRKRELGRLCITGFHAHRGLAARDEAQAWVACETNSLIVETWSLNLIAIAPLRLLKLRRSHII
jgi:hypothetical protein